MEEKLLRQKELKELLFELAQNNIFLVIVPLSTGSTRLDLYTGLRLLHEETFPSYESDPGSCTLTTIRNFKASYKVNS